MFGLTLGLTGCIAPAGTTATGVTTSSSGSVSVSHSATSAPTGSTSATGSTAATGSTGTAGESSSSTGGVGPADCEEDEIFVCRERPDGACGEESACEYDWHGCDPQACSDCDYQCGFPWACTPSDADALHCVPDPDYIGCDVWEQNCPDGYKCMPYANDGGSSWNASKCTLIDPEPVGVGEVCEPVGGGVSGVDNCELGSMCWNVDSETNEGTCVGMCQGSPDEPVCDDVWTSCRITSEGVLNLCLPICDPLLQNCPGDDLCIPQPGGDTFMCVLDASGEGGAYGDPCEYANACDAGLICINPEYVEGCKAPGCCTPFCDLDAPPSCPGENQECIPWYEPGDAPEMFEHVGVCGVPQ